MSDACLRRHAIQERWLPNFIREVSEVVTPAQAGVRLKFLSLVRPRSPPLARPALDPAFHIDVDYQQYYNKYALNNHLRREQPLILDAAPASENECCERVTAGAPAVNP